MAALLERVRALAPTSVLLLTPTIDHASIDAFRAALGSTVAVDTLGEDAISAAATASRVAASVAASSTAAAVILLPQTRSSVDSLNAASAGTALTLAGFVDVVAGEAGVTARKPTWNTGAAAPVTLKKKAAVVAPSEPAAATWGVVLTSSDAPVALIDEDDLLAADTGSVPTSAPADCGPTASAAGSVKRRACKNCTCGLADAPAAVVVDTSVQEAKADMAKSSCGNCWKGDAFRCATCPHMGKPAFKAGTDGVLMLDASASDF